MAGQSFDMVERRMARVLRDRLAEEVAIGIEGPRSVGKSTLLRNLATEMGVAIIDLDDPAVREAVEADPRTFVQGPAPVCIDEYQKAKIILDAIKAELNTRQAPGRFVLTGSTSYASLPADAQALTGRLHVLELRPLSQGELASVAEDFVEVCLDDPATLVTPAVSTTTRAEYIDRIVTGGFPMVHQRPKGPARNRWFDDYLRQTIERDLLDISRVQQREKLPRLLARLAGQAAQSLNLTAAARDVSIEPTTAANYTKLLEAVFLVYRLPAWGRNLRARAAALPKIHIVDAGVAARVLRLTPERLALLQPAALTEFGHLLETFVVGEILKQVSWLDENIAPGHWRTHDGDEVDLVLERDDGRIVAFEVKAGSRVKGTDLSGMEKLRDMLGDSFIGGVALYTGDRAYTYGDKVHVMPIDRLWTPSSAL